jgi:hypothetical protein
MVVLSKGGRLLDLGMCLSAHVDLSINQSVDSPLAKGFPILSGRVEVQVPNVTAGSDYSVVGMCMSPISVYHPANLPST